MKKAFPWRKENLVRQQSDQDDDDHDPDHLIHRVQFAPVMEEMAQTESGENRHVNLRGHERTPGKSPALFHATNEIWQRRRQNDTGPFVKVVGTHRPGGAGIDWWNRAHARISGDYDRPDRAHNDNKQHRHLGLPKPKQRQGDPADARQGLQAEREHADRVFHEGG